jgi:hypothetical protein
MIGTPAIFVKALSIGQSLVHQVSIESHSAVMSAEVGRPLSPHQQSEFKPTAESALANSSQFG